MDPKNYFKGPRYRMRMSCKFQLLIDTTSNVNSASFFFFFFRYKILFKIIIKNINNSRQFYMLSQTSFLTLVNGCDSILQLSETPDNWDFFFGGTGFACPLNLPHLCRRKKGCLTGTQVSGSIQ